MVHAKGKSRGILFLWDKYKLNSRVIISSQNFCSIIFSSIVFLETFIVMNAYAPTTCAGRIIIWYYVNQMREAFMGLSWCMVGDFNFSLDPSKKG